MRLYLDDDMAAHLLVRLLVSAGHDVESPVDCGLVGANDANHLTHAISVDRAVITANYDDFESLHNLIHTASGKHPGILVVRQDNNPRRDLTAQGIVRCIRNFEAAGLPLRDQFVILNHWR